MPSIQQGPSDAAEGATWEPGIGVGVPARTAEANRMAKLAQRDPREVQDVQRRIAAVQREVAFELANLQATLDREYESAVKSLGSRAGDPSAVAYGPGGIWGLPIPNPGGPFGGR